MLILFDLFTDRVRYLWFRLGIDILIGDYLCLLCMSFCHKLIGLVILGRIGWHIGSLLIFGGRDNFLKLARLLNRLLVIGLGVLLLLNDGFLDLLWFGFFYLLDLLLLFVFLAHLYPGVNLIKFIRIIVTILFILNSAKNSFISVFILT